MKRERALEAKNVRTRNELVDCLEREEVVIFVESDLYDKMKEELGTPKMSKTVGMAGLGVGVLALSCKRQVLSSKKWQLISSIFGQLSTSILYTPTDCSVGIFH